MIAPSAATPKKALPRTRAVAAPGSEIGPVRYELYRQAFSKINAAHRQGFYLEAITLVESLVADRLESRLTYLLEQDVSFKTLGTLIDKAKKHETDGVLHSIIISRLDNWRNARNEALHEMAKLASGDYRTWDDRTKGLIPISKDGVSILRAIDNRYRQLRRFEKNKQLAVALEKQS